METNRNQPLDLRALLMKTLDIMASMGDNESLYDHLSDQEIWAVRTYFLPALRSKRGPCA